MDEESEEEPGDSYNKEFEKWPSRGDRGAFKIESAKECSLKEITGKEKKVAVIGTLKSVDKKDMQGVLSDGTEECIVVFTEGDMLPGVLIQISTRKSGNWKKSTLVGKNETGFGESRRFQEKLRGNCSAHSRG
ncbi:MAG: hypothetical protein NT067_03300 [Candidatus Diapherotrites archaeon]|nr:hypothetical protein [Candidatus Diapherotrites archaeon]